MNGESPIHERPIAPIEIEFAPGCHINEAAEQLCVAAQNADTGQAAGVFNGIRMFADKLARADVVAGLWQADMDAAARAYATSPEGIAATEERERRRSDAQQKHDLLMRRLKTLNFADDVAVLDWLGEMQSPSDHAGVIVRKDTIVAAFEKRGFVAGANCGADFRPNNRGNTFRYLVGQALDGLKTGPAIHGIFHKFHNEWKAKFSTVTAEQEK